MAVEKLSPKNPIPRHLYNILACPLCKSDIRYSKDKKSLICIKCKTVYPIENGIPNLLPPDQRF